MKSSEYIVIPRSYLEAEIRIAEEYNLETRLGTLSELFNISKPLHPIIEDAFEAGKDFELYSTHPELFLKPQLNAEEYINNLNL